MREKGVRKGQGEVSSSKIPRYVKTILIHTCVIEWAAYMVSGKLCTYLREWDLFQ